MFIGAQTRAPVRREWTYRSPLGTGLTVAEALTGCLGEAAERLSQVEPRAMPRPPARGDGPAAARNAIAASLARDRTGMIACVSAQTWQAARRASFRGLVLRAGHGHPIKLQP